MTLKSLQTLGSERMATESERDFIRDIPNEIPSKLFQKKRLLRTTAKHCSFATNAPGFLRGFFVSEIPSLFALFNAAC